MIRRPPRSTLDRSSAASDVYKRQDRLDTTGLVVSVIGTDGQEAGPFDFSQAPAHGQVPVSYTHLRAHETVLDLVCRLLLEKKKKTTNNTHNNTQHTTHIIISDHRHLEKQIFYE